LVAELLTDAPVVRSVTVALFLTQPPPALP
jgi:hypothetical protein